MERQFTLFASCKTFLHGNVCTWTMSICMLDCQPMISLVVHLISETWLNLPRWQYKRRNHPKSIYPHLVGKCQKANTPDHIFTHNPHVVSSQQLIALSLILRAARWFNNIEQWFWRIDLKPIFDKLCFKQEGPISIQQFWHRIETDTKMFYRDIIDYVQLALTGIATVYIVHLIMKILHHSVFPKISFGCTKCKRDHRIKEYTVVSRQPKPFRPSPKARNIINDELQEVQPSDPVLKKISPV